LHEGKVSAILDHMTTIPEATTPNRHPELLEQLSEGIAKLTTSEAWQRYLRFQARFHRYSFGNTLLIAGQRPYATQVAGFHAWRKLNRFVRKGEKAIFILAPMVGKKTDEDGEEKHFLFGFRWVPVFDVSQTDGDPLPTVCSALEGADENGCFDRLTEVARGLGFSVEITSLSGPHGVCSHNEHTIKIEEADSPLQQVKTLAHEIAHAILHEKAEGERGLIELEAESTAYVVCQSLGLDSADYSFGYVAAWASGGSSALAGIKASGERIQKAAAQILQSFEREGQPA